MLIKTMPAKALFIPGLFVMPNSQKFGALRDALSFAEMEIVDFSRLYQQKLVYQDFVDILTAQLKELQPDLVIGYSLGCSLYQNALGKNPELEATANALIVPVGNYRFSKNGNAVLNNEALPQDIYKPIRELKAAPYVSTDFFKSMAEDGMLNKTQKFRNQSLAISGTQDEDVDPDAYTNLKQQNVARRLLMDDGHRMTNTMPDICETIRSFSLNCIY